MPDTLAPTLGEPIVIHNTVTACDSCGAEWQIVTDGYRAYGWSGLTPDAEATLFARSTLPAQETVIVAACPRHVARTDDTCHGQIRADLTTDGWEQTTPSTAWLLALGDRIED